jgi:hypothetical protein
MNMDFSMIQFIFTIIVLVMNVGMFIAIKFNDLKHLEIAMKELKNCMEKHGEKIDRMNTRVSRMEGKLGKLSK